MSNNCLKIFLFVLHAAAIWELLCWSIWMRNKFLMPVWQLISNLQDEQHENWLQLLQHWWCRADAPVKQVEWKVDRLTDSQKTEREGERDKQVERQAQPGVVCLHLSTTVYSFDSVWSSPFRRWCFLLNLVRLFSQIFWDVFNLLYPKYQQREDKYPPPIFSHNRMNILALSISQ